MKQNIFVINGDVHLDNNKLLIFNKNLKKEIPINAIDNIFWFSERGIKDSLKENLSAVPIYKINYYGNINYLQIPKKRYKNMKNIEDIVRYIFKITFFQIKGYIKTLPYNVKSVYWEVGLFDKYDTIVDSKLHEISIKEAISLIKQLYNQNLYWHVGGDRMYSSKGRRNAFINFFHSLYIAYITSVLAKKGINPYQNIFNKKSNYPDFSCLVFNLFKIGATLNAYNLFSSFHNRNDKRMKFHTIKNEERVAISRLFSEKFIHNTKAQERLENHILNILKIHKGEAQDVLWSN